MRPRAAQDMVRIHLQIRAEQRAAIERLEDEHDLNQGQVIRRLLDLGLAAWPTHAESADAPTPATTR